MIKQILAAIDLDDQEKAAKILHFARDMANLNSADLHLITVIGSAEAVISQHLPEGYEKMAMKGIDSACFKVSQGSCINPSFPGIAPYCHKRLGVKSLLDA